MKIRLLDKDLIRIDKAYYFWKEIPCSIGGRGFEIVKQSSKEMYHVRVSDDEVSCECMGFLRHGRCKHVMALTALVNRA